MMVIELVPCVSGPLWSGHKITGPKGSAEEPNELHRCTRATPTATCTDRDSRFGLARSVLAWIQKGRNLELGQTPRSGSGLCRKRVRQWRSITHSEIATWK